MSFFSHDSSFPSHPPSASDASRSVNSSRGAAILLVTHRWGGGTERHVKHMASLLSADGIPIFICRMETGEKSRVLIEPICGAGGLSLSITSNETDIDRFSEAMRQMRIAHVHIHHLANFPESASDFFRAACRRAGIQYDITLHDYLTVCPRISLSDASGMYCGEPEEEMCEHCVSTLGAGSFGHPSVRQWRIRFARLLGDARRVFVPSNDVAMRVARFMPNAVFTLRPHPALQKLSNAQPELGRRSSGTIQARSIRHIAVIGAIVSHKGSRLLQDVARFAQGEKLPIHFSLIGYTDRNRALSALDNVDISGPYEPDQEESLLAHADADLVWFPYVIPETYSYTLSTALHAGLFPIAFDFGAVAERLRAIGWGELLPYELMLDPPEVARRLMEAKITPAPADLRQDIFIEYEQPVTVSYYGFASWPPAKERQSALTS